ncbi:hypothetical protein DID75_00275 [Candidatus Marinamargulisbacteria bacterium SCGC AG-410-N11]|nr:hypothetical protein DID75_00275 [Candidatus Marinamargulisbacteria bacterium SCGC AG-410-N11]
MKIVFFGCTNFSKELFDHLQMIKNINIKAIFSIPEQFNISYSKTKVKNYNYYSFYQDAKELNIPFYEVNSKENDIIDYKSILSDIEPDLILAFGWYYMIPKQIRRLAKYGVWGMHASLLPNYAGGAPLVWAMINGEKTTGISLFKLEDGIDNGPIIAQEKFQIDKLDTIKNVIDKSVVASKKILTNIFRQNLDKIKYTHQDQSKIKVYPQRSPDDGEIDFSMSAEEIYDFVRAQGDPYPGAFIKSSDNKRIVVEKIRIEEF